MTRRGLTGWAVFAIWAIGLGFLVAIATLATGQVLASVVSANGISRRVIEIAAILGWVLVATLLLSGKGPLRTHPLALGIAVIVMTRLWALTTIQTPIVSDFAVYQGMAVSFIQHGLSSNGWPIGWPLAVAGVYRITGPNPLNAEVLNVAISVATGFLIYDLGVRIFGRPAGAVGLWLFAFSPAQALWVVVLGTEAPYGLLLTAAVWIVVRFGFDRVWPAVLIGAILGVAQYVRPTTPALLVAISVAAVLALGLRARAGRTIVAIAAGFLIVLSPVIAHSVETTGTPSISTSLFGGWSLFVGTSSANTGQYDRSLLTIPVGQEGTAEFDHSALELALKRIRHDPLGVAVLAIEKVPIMWGSEDYATAWTFSGSSGGTTETIGNVLTLSGQLVYAATLILAAYGVWRWRRRTSGPVVLILLLLLSVATIHSLLEVQSRYHLYLEPLLCVLAGGGLATTRFGRRLELVPESGAEASPAGDPVAGDWPVPDAT